MQSQMFKDIKLATAATKKKSKAPAPSTDPKKQGIAAKSAATKVAVAADETPQSRGGAKGPVKKNRKDKRKEVRKEKRRDIKKRVKEEKAKLQQDQAQSDIKMKDE